jgi:hypothetical protein
MKMKKFLFLAAAFLLGLSACQKDDLGDGSGKSVNVRVSANIPSEMQLARSTEATTPEPGDGSRINRCIMEIYHKQGEEYVKYGERRVVALAEKAATFNDIRLVTGQTYKFVFWADCANGTTTNDFVDNHFNTEDLANVSIADAATYTGNDDTRDAFFGSREETIEIAKDLQVTLSRPFGQLNIKTNDMSEIPDESLKPTKVDIKFKSVYTAINLLTGELVGTPGELSYSGKITLVNQSAGKLSLDYVFAGVNQENLADFTMGFYNDAEEEVVTAYNFSNIPLQRNYKTNVSGNLLTKKANITVTVDPAFNQPDITKEIVEVASVNEANKALEAGAKNIVIKEAPQEDATISLPKYATTKEEISITLPAITNQKVTIECPTESVGGQTNAPAVLNVTIPEAKEIEITTPQSTVTLNGTTYDKVTATTAANTLVIASDVTVKELHIKQGNVKIYGTVTKITKEEAWQGEIIRCVASQADLNRALTNATTYPEGIDYAYLLIEQPASGLNGGGKTLNKRMEIAANAELSNLIINSPKGNGITLAADDTNVVLDGLTIYQNEVDLTNGYNCAILAANHNNLKLTVKNSHLIVPKSNQRGINIHSAKDPSSVCTITLDNTHIGPTLEIIGDGDYTAEQNNIFKDLSDLRGISIASHEGNIIVKLQNNSIIEGVFYAINSVQHHDNFEIYVENSRLDGRCAFNIWSDGKAIINTNNSKLIGRNPFGGPTEIFATIVVNQKDGNWAGAANNTITVKDSEIHCYNNPETPTNIQYAVDMRSSFKNVLNLLGNTKIYDKSASQRLPHAIDVGYWINEINVDPTVEMIGNQDATILPSAVWDGSSITYPGVASDGTYYIGTPEELAGASSQKLEKVKVILVRDLDLNGYTWETQDATNSTFDGQGHIISNFTISNEQKAGLFPNAISVTIKNLTLKNATITATDDGKQNAYAGGFIGRCYGTNIVENCVLDGCSVQGINKVGGIIGFNAEDGTTIKNCTVKGCTIKTDDTKTEHGQCGAILGYAGLLKEGTTLITGNYVIDTKVEAAQNTNAGETHRYNSIYVGAFQGSAKDKLTIDAPTNAVRNSTLNGKAPETSKYLGLLGGIRFPETLATTTILTINGKRYTE